VVCRFTCTPHRVTYTRGRIETIDSPDDKHLVARNMYRIGMKKYKKKNCASSWSFTKTFEYTVTSSEKCADSSLVLTCDFLSASVDLSTYVISLYNVCSKEF